MSEATHLADALSSFFSNAENGAFADFATATAGLSAGQAAAVSGERMNSIWAVVNHVWFWNEVPLRELRGETVVPEDLGASNWNGWVPIGDPTDEAAWQADRERALATNAAFTAAVQALSPEQLAADLAGHGPVHHIVQVMVAHNAYHLGEIVTLRHLQGLWVDHKLV